MFGFAFSKSIDDASQSTGASAGGYALAIDSRNLKLEHARSDFDRGHAFTAVFSHPIPAGSHRRYLSGRQRGARELATRGRHDGDLGPGADDHGLLGQHRHRRVQPAEPAGRRPVGEAPKSGRRGVDCPWYDISAFVPPTGCISRTDCSPGQYGCVSCRA